MPIKTRAQANRILDEEFTILRNISIECDNTADFVQVQITPSETGEGTHIRWTYPTTTPAEHTPEKTPTTIWSGSDESPPVHTPELKKTEPSKYYAVETLEPTPPATPTAPNRPCRTYAKAAVINTGECIYFWRRPGEDVETAIRRTVEMYYREAAQREGGSRRRVWNFVRGHPIPPPEDDGTRLFVREDSAWDSDPFQ